MSIFPEREKIVASIKRWIRQNPGVPHKLDTIGTSGSVSLSYEVRASPGQKRDQPPTDHWQKEKDSRELVRRQMKVIFEAADRIGRPGDEFTLHKAHTRIKYCGSAYIVEKHGPANYSYKSSFHCKSKYCPRCASKKRDLLIARYANFFEKGVGESRKLLEEHDLCLLTVTLRHGEHSRGGWYFKELQTHFRNSLKYGAFNKYIKGGAYQTEVNIGSNGFHIHRHAIVLIPKVFGVADAGKWTGSQGNREFRWINPRVANELRNAWHQRTGDSFQIDLRPFDPAQTLAKNLSEIFKYLSKGTGQDEGKNIVAPEIVAEILKNPLDRFYGRFGNLYNIKELKINEKDEYQAGAADPLDYEPDLYIAKGLYKTRKGWSFRHLQKLPRDEKGGNDFAMFRRCVAQWKENSILALQGRAFRKRISGRSQLPDEFDIELPEFCPNAALF